jgi:hypothetical protein
LNTVERLACLRALGITRRALARASGYHEWTVRQWLCGQLTCPPAVDNWLRRRADAMLADPCPRARTAIGRTHKPDEDIIE